MKLDFDLLPLTIGIVGSRDFPECRHVTKFVERLRPGTLVVSGGARGVDKAAELAAKAREDLPEPKIYLPDENLPAPARFFARNSDIVKHVKLDGGLVVAFLLAPAKTGGTQDTLDKCDKYDMPTIAFRMTVSRKWLEPELNHTMLVYSKWQALWDGNNV